MNDQDETIRRVHQALSSAGVGHLGIRVEDEGGVAVRALYPMDVEQIKLALKSIGFAFKNLERGLDNGYYVVAA